MSTEELLRPRYKVIIKAPGCFKVGTIIEKHKYASGEWYVPNYMYDPEEFPDVFKKLEWYEERKPEEMPEYLNCPSRKMFFKVESWHKSYFIIDGRQKMQYRNYIPATLAEYEQYINQKEKQ